MLSISLSLITQSMFTFHFSNIVKDKDRQIVSFVENYFVSSNKNLDLNVKRFLKDNFIR